MFVGNPVSYPTKGDVPGLGSSDSSCKQEALKPHPAHQVLNTPHGVVKHLPEASSSLASDPVAACSSKWVRNIWTRTTRSEQGMFTVKWFFICFTTVRAEDWQNSSGLLSIHVSRRVQMVLGKGKDNKVNCLEFSFPSPSWLPTVRTAR